MQRRSLGFRLWHWLDAAVIFALLGTVLLRNTLFNPRGNASVIRDRLEAAGVAVSADQARGVARALIDDLWAWHVYFGYALAALAVVRGVLLLVDRGRGPAAAPTRDLHHRLVKGFHKSFYVALVILVITGLLLAFKKGLSLGRPVEQAIHAVHENLMWYVIAFVALHIAGVIRAELQGDAGLVSQMIHGKDEAG